MALNKVYAATRHLIKIEVPHEDGTSHFESQEVWTEQRDVQMHPLEEEATLKYWAIQEHVNKIPVALTQEEEHELILSHGIDEVKNKRTQRQSIADSVNPDVESATKAHQEAEKAWNDHAALCHANGHDYDSYPGDARLTLKMPEGKNNG